MFFKKVFFPKKKQFQCGNVARMLLEPYFTTLYSVTLFFIKIKSVFLFGIKYFICIFAYRFDR